MPNPNTVECFKLVDGKVSVRVNGVEVHILPIRKDCTMDDIEEAIQVAVDHVDPEGEEQSW